MVSTLTVELAGLLRGIAQRNLANVDVRRVGGLLLVWRAEARGSAARASVRMAGERRSKGIFSSRVQHRGPEGLFQLAEWS